MPEITMPTALWQKLEDIATKIGTLEAKVDSCAVNIKEARDYQKIQNGKIADAIAAIGEVRREESAAAGRERGVSTTWKIIGAVTASVTACLIVALMVLDIIMATRR